MPRPERVVWAETRWEVAEAWEEPGVSGEGSHLGGGGAHPGCPLHLSAHLLTDHSLRSRGSCFYRSST